MSDHAIENARAWAETIHEYYLAMDPETWDRFEDLKENGPTCQEDEDELAELARILADFTDEDDAREKAQDSALEVELTGSWHHGEKPVADSYIILLSTGGPALRIVGQLNKYSEPGSATLEWQDWGTPWTEFPADEDELLAFASVFYFGE